MYTSILTPTYIETIATSTTTYQHVSMDHEHDEVSQLFIDLEIGKLYRQAPKSYSHHADENLLCPPPKHYYLGYPYPCLESHNYPHLSEWDRMCRTIHRRVEDR